MTLRKLTMLLTSILLGCAGCAGQYLTPASGVSLSGTSLAEVSEENLVEIYNRNPASPFPANIAVIRVQDAGYVTRSNRGYGHGRYTVVTTRDIETDEAFEKLSGMPLVSGVAPIGRLLLPPETQSIRDLRTPAAKLRADMLLVYSVDTAFSVDGRALGPLSLISLGLIPNKKAHVTSTVAGALVDVRTGFVYGTTEATATEQQRASIWSTELAIDSARLRAETSAFDSFVTKFEQLWTSTLNVHAASRGLPSRNEAAVPGGGHVSTYHTITFDPSP